MESVTILRELWRLRVAVIIVGVLALLVGYGIAYGFSVPPKPRSYTVGVASARILVDTPNSQVVEVAPKGSETLGARANVLANLMIDGTIKDEIAKRAGLRPDELVTGSLATGGAAEDHKLTASSYALTTGVVLNTDQAELPIIRVETQAPDTQKAIGLADAAVKGLDDYLNVRADDERIESTRRLQVSGLGPAQGHDAARGTGRIMALAVAHHRLPGRLRRDPHLLGHRPRVADGGGARPDERVGVRLQRAVRQRDRAAGGRRRAARAQAQGRIADLGAEMGFGSRLRELWHIRGWVALCLVLALAAAVWSVANISLFPPSLSSRSLKLATATTQVVVDTPRSTLVDTRQDTYSLDALTNRAVLLGNVMASPPVREAIASQADVPFSELQVLPPLTPKQPRALSEAGNERKTSDILKLNDQYRLVVQANPTVPFLQVYAQAPDVRSATALADAAVDSMKLYLTKVAGSARTPDDEQIKLVQLGRAHGTVIDNGISWRVALLAFCVSFAVLCATAIYFRRVREGWRVASLEADAAAG